MRVTALAGGVGAARFLRGLVAVVENPSVVVNVGDDLRLHGLHVSPDLDSITYTLGGGVHPEQEWGRADETFAVATELEQRYSRSRWFMLGDRDLATHLVRTEILSGGGTLSQATEAVAAAWQVPARLLPVTDDPLTTRILTRDGRDLHFQRWWVGEHAAADVAGVRYDGAARARPAPGVVEAIEAADLVVVCPSNPVVSIGVVLAVPGVREAVARSTVVGVSPIVGGAVVRGMADRLLPAVGCPVSAAGVAGLYADLLDGWVVDQVDADATAAVPSGIEVVATQTVMHSPAVATALAQVVVDLGARLAHGAAG